MCSVGHHSSSSIYLRWYWHHLTSIYSDTTWKKPWINKFNCSYWSGETEHLLLNVFHRNSFHSLLPPEIVSPQEKDSGPGADFGPDLFPPSHLVSTTVCSTLESLLYFTLETLAGIPVATAIPFIRSGLYLYFLFNMPSRHRPRIPSFMSDRAKPQTLNTFPISHLLHKLKCTCIAFPMNWAMQWKL